MNPPRRPAVLNTDADTLHLPVHIRRGPLWQGSSPQFKAVLLTLLLVVERKPWPRYDASGGRVVQMPAGTYCTTRAGLADEAGVGVAAVRAALRRMQSCGFIQLGRAGRRTLITLCQWESFAPGRREPADAGAPAFADEPDAAPEPLPDEEPRPEAGPEKKPRPDAPTEDRPGPHDVPELKQDLDESIFEGRPDGEHELAECRALLEECDPEVREMTVLYFEVMLDAGELDEPVPEALESCREDMRRLVRNRPPQSDPPPSKRKPPPREPVVLRRQGRRW
jgi:hypothetical protein